MDIAVQSRSIVDALCESSSGERFLIEIQKVYQRGFRQRMLYYGATIFSSQLDIGNADYASALRNVVVIAISNGPLLMSNQSHISHHQLLDLETHRCELEGLNFHFIDLTKFQIKVNELELVNSPVDAWCFYLKFIHELNRNDLAAFKRKYPWMEKAVDELSKFNLSKEEYKSYLLYRMGMSGDPSNSAVELEEDVKNLVKKQIAEKMLADDCPIDKVCKYTGLNKEDFVK